MKLSRALTPVIAAGVIAVSLVACGSNSGGGGSDADANLDGRGPITYVQGKDNNGIIAPLIEKWNAAHPNEKVTFKEQTDEADQQHDDLVQNFQAKNANYDVVDVDVVWTAEFAAKNWLQPLTGKMAFNTDGFLPATVSSATYNNTLYAAPQTSDGALLYYRKDLMPTPPKTWDDMMASCSKAKDAGIGCYGTQLAQYEGLTVNAAEMINSTDGRILDKDGKIAIDSSQAKEGLSNLVEAYKNGNIPKEAITFKEEPTRQAFESGKLMYMRNWPYAYSLVSGDATSQVKDKFGIAPIPGKSGPGASTLGGHSAAINVYSKHKATALDFLKFLTSAETQKYFATQGSLAPVLSSTYDDADVKAKLPYISTLKTSIQNAVPRPVTPFYPAVTKAIQDNVYSALKGDKSVDQTLSDIKTAMQSAGVK